jgi:3-oxoacyl-(acyl-carrier-protein) synthase
VVSTQGSGVSAAWDALEASRPAGALFDPGGDGPPHFAAAIPDDYRPHPGIPRNLAHFLDRGALIAIDAALQALDSAGLAAGAGDARRFAVADGLAFRAPGQPTLFVPYGHLVARALGVRGAVVETGGAEASGMAALAACARLIAQGDADVVVAGAAQALQRPVLDHLAAQGHSAESPARPFDAAHAGLVPAEAAAYIVLEAEDHARDRGATVVARLEGVGETFDASAEPLATSDAPEAGRAMQAALAGAGFLQNQVDLTVSCADGRPTVDFAEGYGLRRTFGRHAYYAGVTTVAGSLGHALAASGPLSVALACEAMRRQRVFPIAGFETPEQDVELAYLREARDEKVDCALVTSLGVGGANVSLILSR